MVNYSYRFLYSSFYRSFQSVVPVIAFENVINSARVKIYALLFAKLLDSMVNLQQCLMITAALGDSLRALVETVSEFAVVLCVVAGVVGFEKRRHLPCRLFTLRCQNISCFALDSAVCILARRAHS